MKAKKLEKSLVMNIFRTTRANFRLVFLGDISDIRDEVRRVIMDKADRTEGTDYKVLLVDRFIIDISSKFPDGYSTPKPPPAGNIFTEICGCNPRPTQRINFPIDLKHLSRLMTKPTQWLCAQWRLRSAWASAQSDQSFRCALNG